MIQELSVLVEEFPGAANQTRCFLHILNLVVQSIIKKFDLPKAQEDILGKAKTELFNLAGNIQPEELQSQQETNSDEDDDNTEGWVDECEEMTAWEQEDLDESVGPLILMLTKLHKTAFTIKNSTTIILQKWFSILEDLGLDAHMMPHDVTACWNSTYDMLEFALSYCTALDNATSDHEMKLRQFKLSEEDWGIAAHLHDALKVSM
ncbi:hypothetical protein BYT27DRAFT_7095431 [Phlegmacium glaucopus]|nr:hypothetical protein BYT27DRAFT_7095431 [Phlegmacium glaucopus]